jgi:hypothetical protein
LDGGQIEVTLPAAQDDTLRYVTHRHAITEV